MKRPFALLALAFVASASAQVHVHHEVSADAYDPAHATDSADYPTEAAWNAHGRVSQISATSESHPFDPPINVATASSRFAQPLYRSGALRDQSFVISDYSGLGLTAGYAAATTFDSGYLFSVITGGTVGHSITYRTALLFHGLMSARGAASTYGGTGIAHAEQSFKVSRAAAPVDSAAGTLDLVSTDANVSTWTATGDWVGGVTSTTVALPTGSQPRNWDGIELFQSKILNFGSVPTASTTVFGIDQHAATSVAISSAGSKHALADFSNTTTYEIQAFDETGARFYDFNVVPVPEPASLAALALGLVALSRRMRRESGRSDRPAG